LLQRFLERVEVVMLVSANRGLQLDGYVEQFFLGCPCLECVLFTSRATTT
tara:strand:+ start:4485 stop:4634 length:150 start_codon:yes stop_codon:yes gene_type:complete